MWRGNDDTTDVSAGGYVNGEFYGAFSTDHGLTWSDYVNLTNTRSPGAPPGDCMDEDYMTANPFVVHDSIYLTYVEDKDAGACMMLQAEGVPTINPVRCWVFHKNRVIYGVEEESQSRKLKPEGLRLEVFPNPFSQEIRIRYIMHDVKYKVEDISVKLFDVSGKEVVSNRIKYESKPCTIDTRDLPCGVYFVAVRAGEGCVVKKVIKIK